MKVDWSGREKEILDKLGSMKFIPDNVEELQRKVMSRINTKEKPDTRFIGWARIAAGVLIFLLVGTYVFEEGFTHYSRFKMEGSLLKTDCFSVRSENCKDVIQYYLSVNSRVNFLGQSKDTVLLSQADVAFLKKLYPDSGLRIDEFMNAMKKFYPLDYARFRSGDVVELNVNTLKNDTRLCELLVNNR
jgi:hypothetical protein